MSIPMSLPEKAIYGLPSLPNTTFRLGFTSSPGRTIAGAPAESFSRVSSAILLYTLDDST